MTLKQPRIAPDRLQRGAPTSLPVRHNEHFSLSASHVVLDCLFGALFLSGQSVRFQPVSTK